MKRFKLALEELEQEQQQEEVSNLDIDPELMSDVNEEGVEDLESIGDVEQAVAIEELSEDLSTQVIENERVLDVADNLEDLTVIADKIEEPSLTENALIQTAANMAVAGTDTDASAIVPAIESFKNKEIAIEQLRVKIAVAHESIFESIKNIYSKFKEFLKKLFNFTYKIESQIKQAKDLLSQVKTSKVKEISIKVKSNRMFAKDATTIVSDSDDFIKSLTESLKAFDKISSLAVKSVIDFNGSVKEFFQTLISKKATDAASARLYDAYIKDYIVSLTKLPGMTKSESKDGYDIYNSGALLGSYGLMVASPHNPPKIEMQNERIINSVQAKYAVRTSLVSFRKNIFSPVGESTKKTIDFTLDAKKIEQLISASEHALQIFKRFLNETYKSFTNYAVWLEGYKVNTPLTSLHTTLVNSGINNTIQISAYCKSYASNLASAPLGLALTALKSKQWLSLES